MQLISEADYRTTMQETVLPFLASVKREGCFQGYDGATLHWCAYASPNPSQTVVLVHGFTESTEKYAELIWYFLRSGANVYLYDQRGHGSSYRAVEDLTLTHVERFDEYVKDLEQFVSQIVPKDLPLRLFAHSMGGAVAALYLETHNGVFSKAVLSSPMIAPARGNVPLFAGKLICRGFSLFGKARERIFLSGEYPGKEEFEDSCATSRARFAFYEERRRTTPTLQNYSPTYRWTLESLKVTSRILRRNAPERVSTEVLLCIAQEDTVVLIPPQKQFASRLPHCRVNLYDAKHEIYSSTDDTLRRYVNDILSFLR